MSTNWNSTIPSAPSGARNVTFQNDGSGNMSAYADGTPFSSSLDFTAQSAAIVTANLFTTTTAGIYRLSYYLNVTTAGNAVNLTGTFGWTDDSTVSSSLTTANIACNTLGANSTTALGLGSIDFYAAASTNITYATALSGAIGSGRYSARLRLENLG